MKFTINYAPKKSEAVSVCELSQFHLKLKMAAREEYFQVQLSPEDDESIKGLNAYFNANRAWIVWNNAEGEWLYPANPNHHKIASSRTDS